MKTLRNLTVIVASLLTVAASAQERLTSADQITTGWYRLKCTVAAESEAAYVGCYWLNAAQEYEQNANSHYPILLQTSPATPADDDATYYIHLVRNESAIYVQSANGHFLESHAFSTITPWAASFKYSDQGFAIGPGWRNWPTLGNIIGLQAASAGKYLYDIFPVNPAEASLDAWQVEMKGIHETSTEAYRHTQVACSTNGLKGLQKVYDKGFFFLPTGTTPQPTDFTVEGETPKVTIDAENKTVTLTFESNAVDVVEVKQGYQTAGRGNERTLLLRIDLQRNVTGAKLTALGIKLNEETRRNISALSLWQTAGTEFFAIRSPNSLGTFEPTADDLTIPLDYTMKSGTNHLWLTATVNADATLGEALDAALTSITISANGEEKTVDVAATVGDPAGVARIFATQSFAFIPSTDNCQFYRIPAMILDKEGNIVVAADRRYGSNSDLGNHKIDVSIRRSEDGGHTWSAQNIIAVGDGKETATYGYGDPALARTQNGRLICVMAAGSVMYWNGMRNAAICLSDDNGLTWTKPRQLYSSNFTDAVNGTTNSLGFYGNFISSGKGLTTKDGTVMFTNNCLTYEDKSTPQCYIIYSTDDGDSWTLGPGNAYRGCDESKLEQMNNGDLLVSVRQSGARGFNTGSTDASTWDSQWRNSQISGNACNADILYYSRSTEGQRDIMLHSYINSSSRENLTLAMSIDQGASWQDFMNIQPGGSCYSTMVRLPNGDLALLYEDESYSAGNGYAINFLTITEEQINAFADEMKANVGKEYQRALDKLENGGVYYFATNYLNDEPVRGIYYLKADGTLTTNGMEAKYFTLQKRAVGGGFMPIGWKSGQFTNPTNATTNTTYIRTDSQNRDTWEAQVITLGDNGFYAIRATNAPTDDKWGSNAYWTTDSEGNATYDLKGGAHYIWRIVKVGSTPRFDANQTYRIKTPGQDNEYAAMVIGSTQPNPEGVAIFGYSNIENLKENNPKKEFTHDFYLIPVANQLGSFQIKGANIKVQNADVYATGPEVSTPGATWNGTGATPVSIRIQKIEMEGATGFVLQAPYACGFRNGQRLGNNAGGSIINNRDDASLDDCLWEILTTDEDIALGIQSPYMLPSHQAEAGSRLLFSPNGQRLQQPRRGLNIIRHSDGSVQKVIKK